MTLQRSDIINSLVLVLCTAVPVCAQLAISGSLVSAETGAPVAGATIVTSRPPVGTTPPLVLRGVSDSRGEFRIDKVTSGVWALCVHAAGGLLDPCVWDKPVTVSVGSAVVSTGVIRLTQGELFEITVEDSGKVLPVQRPGNERVAGVPANTGFALSVTGPRGFTRPLRRVQSQNGYHIYSDYFPRGGTLSLRVASSGMRVRDSGGAALAGSSTQIPITVQKPPVLPSGVKRSPFAGGNPSLNRLRLKVEPGSN